MSKTYRYTVEGTARTFPFDMLRYDSAWPTSDGVFGMELVTQGERGAARERVSVELLSLRTPTVARWNSFGWYVGNVETI